MIGTNINAYIRKNNFATKLYDLENKAYKSNPNLVPASKKYMQAEAFWNDPHNKKMMELSDMLMLYRDKLAERAAKLSDTYIQNVDGSLTKKPRKQPFAQVTVENNYYNVYKDMLSYYSKKIRPFIEKLR